MGNLAEYRRSQIDTLEGRNKLSIPGREASKGVWVEEAARISPKAQLKAPCVIGKGCVIEDGAVIGPCTVIGDRAMIGVGARLEHCILWDNVTVGPGVRLTNCILGANGRVTENVSVYEAAVLNLGGGNNGAAA